MPNKALTIDVNPAAIPSGLVDNWSPLGNTTVFINNIQTPKLSEKTNVGPVSYTHLTLPTTERV